MTRITHLQCTDLPSTVALPPQPAARRVDRRLADGGQLTAWYAANSVRAYLLVTRRAWLYLERGGNDCLVTRDEQGVVRRVCLPPSRAALQQTVTKLVYDEDAD